MALGRTTHLIVLVCLGLTGFGLSPPPPRQPSPFSKGDGSNEPAPRGVPPADSAFYETPPSRITEVEPILAQGEVHTFRSVENKAFGVGEHLEFEIAFRFIRAGSATMSVVDTVRVFGRLCYLVRTTAASSAFFSTLYKVRDRVETLMDAEGLFPWKFEKHLREGRYKADRYATFDQKNGRILYKNDTIPAPPYVQDILSAFYFVRTQPLRVGTPIDLDNFSDGKIYPLRVLVHKKETIRVPAGTFRCVVVEPILRGEGLFKQKGKLMIWLTDDFRHLPVLMKSQILVGSIDARLVSYHGLARR